MYGIRDTIINGEPKGEAKGASHFGWMLMGMRMDGNGDVDDARDERVGIKKGNGTSKNCSPQFDDDARGKGSAFLGCRDGQVEVTALETLLA